MNFYDVHFGSISSALTIYADSFRVSTDSYDYQNILYAIFKSGSEIVAILELDSVRKISKNHVIVWTPEQGLNVGD